ncbi:hypothetical protein LUZ61_015876 [Rhynchospora tenuis]|uniref:F-box/LRR-repeat protein 15/At3g58940/PEG3-like LRR domain-containing protein n=1 Tax=Rhynchospora tenuis TaxID=198213 RepID=A0AAD5Z4F9_9POAL|nr:hypothetical protein LUZ61_015876 [Rhynchospora tenuis]
MTAVIFTESYNFQVPDSVFTSESLHELVFELAYEAISPRSVNLPRLKMLTFKCIEIKDGVMEKLLSGLPSLEEMVLHDCILDSGCISSNTLKHLVPDGCHNETTYPPEILISIPSLASLEMNIRDMGILKFKRLESLVKAHIHFEEFSDEEPLFLTALSNVTSLELVLSISAQMDMKALERKITGFPDFHNLKTLKIGGWCMIHDFNLVARFLLRAPNLKNLTLLHREVCQYEVL